MQILHVPKYQTYLVHSIAMLKLPIDLKQIKKETPLQASLASFVYEVCELLHQHFILNRGTQLFQSLVLNLPHALLGYPNHAPDFFQCHR